MRCLGATKVDAAALAVALETVTGNIAAALAVALADLGRSSRAAGKSAATGISDGSIAGTRGDRPRAAATETVRSASRGMRAAVAPSAARGGED